MKIKSILAIAASGLMLASCQGDASSDNNGLGDLKNATTADSLIYYFGQIEGSKFRTRAERDTTLADSQAKKAYLQGVQAGLSAAKNDNEAYNQGLFLGMQMAMNMRQFKEDYGIDLNKQLFMASLANAINADSLENTQDIQHEFYKIMGILNEEKETREKATAVESLKSEAQTLKLPKISDVVYGEATVKNDSVALQTGDNVALNIQIADLNGREINAPLPKKGKIGARNIAAPLNDMLKTLKSGETGKFITSARSLFGPRVTQLKLDPTQVVMVTLKASILPEETKADKKGDKPLRNPIDGAMMSKGRPN